MVFWDWDTIFIGSIVSHAEVEPISIIDSDETNTCVEASMPSTCGSSPLSESKYIEGLTNGNKEASTSVEASILMDESMDLRLTRKALAIYNPARGGSTASDTIADGAGPLADKELPVGSHIRTYMNLSYSVFKPQLRQEDMRGKAGKIQSLELDLAH
ncbi:hypothetical protein OUZ56_012553 [Daphnia magna]|uniref:Uncharacterized protein n=1 Tax=Daphnia magna TaxID=35525 RepID=A0ABQ9Z3C9_9CRUS|nr:hypothetical protein OUZ56_012553 [Daphnia magna]